MYVSQGLVAHPLKKTEILTEIERLIENDVAGSPTSELKWCRKTPDSISDCLRQKHILICPNTASKLLKHLDYSLKVNRKMIAETRHPDRNQQFEIISAMKQYFRWLQEPIITVDSKKKELIGNFKNPGQKWSLNSEQVLTHEFRSQAVGMANPYGIYDLIRNKGFVVVGTSFDTPEFAVESIELWLNHYGFYNYKNVKRLLIMADAGGSNGYRPRLWKYALYKKICCVYNISVTVCHYPTGASKWNPTDHRLFSFITRNWAGEPLRSYEIILNLIRHTKTKKGLEVQAILNDKIYEKGVKINNEQFKRMNMKNHEMLPQWNYTIVPN